MALNGGSDLNQRLSAIPEGPELAIILRSRSDLFDGLIYPAPDPLLSKKVAADSVEFLRLDPSGITFAPGSDIRLHLGDRARPSISTGRFGGSFLMKAVTRAPVLSYESA